MPFEARELPTVIWVRDEPIVGPFCRHCGWPFSLHADDMRCPVNVWAFLSPSCDCHEIRDVEVTEMVPSPSYVGRKRRMKVTRTVKRIGQKGVPRP